MAFLRTGGGLSSGPRKAESCDTAHSHSPALLKTPFRNCTWFFLLKAKKKKKIHRFFTVLNSSAAWDTGGTARKAKKSLPQLLHSLSTAPSRLSTHQEVVLIISNDLCRWRKWRVCFQNQNVITRGHMESIMTFYNINNLTCSLSNIQLLVLGNWLFLRLSEGRVTWEDVPFQNRRRLQTHFTRLICSWQRHNVHFIPNLLPPNPGQITAGSIIPWEQNIRYCSALFGRDIICIYYWLLLVIFHQGGYTNKC